MTPLGVTMAEGTPERPLVERLFAPIEDRNGARVLAGDLGKTFLIVAVIQTVLALARDPAALVDAALYAVCGAFIWVTASRLAAVLVLLVASGAGVLTVLALLGPVQISWGRHIVLALVTVWIAGRAVQATFDYHRFGKTAKSTPGAGGSVAPPRE
jgi:hypothetical protein